MAMILQTILRHHHYLFVLLTFSAYCQAISVWDGDTNYRQLGPSVSADIK